MKLFLFICITLAVTIYYYPAVGMVTLFVVGICLMPFVVLLASSSLRVILGLIIWLLSFDERKDK